MATPGTARTPRGLLAVVARDDPFSASTWSGTPSRIIGALEVMGTPVIGAYPHVSRWESRTLRALTHMRGYGRSWPRDRPARRLLSERVRRQLQQYAPQAALHMGTGTVATGTHPWRTYLYVDCTFVQWARHSREEGPWSERTLRHLDSIERRALLSADHIFTVSEAAATSLREDYSVSPSRLTIVGTGRGAIQPGGEGKDYSNGKLLFVAKERLADKGLGVLLAAFAIARKQQPHLTLTLVGNVDNYPAEAGNADGVSITGRLSDADLQRTFEEASLFVMPAPNEPWGLVYLEALSCAVPVLGLARNAFPEISGHGAYGWMVDSDTAEAVADKIVEATRNPKELEARGVAGRQHCLQKYTWTAVAEALVSVHDSNKE